MPLALTLTNVKPLTRFVSATAEFSPDCRAGSLQLQTNAHFQDEENKRVCFEPEPVPKVTGEYISRCNSSEAWEKACAAAGGEVCFMKASYFGRYGGVSTEEATYRWETDICIPQACKKGSNLKQATSYFIDTLCPLYDFTKCSMTFTCKNLSARTAVIVGATLGALSIIGILSVLIYFVYHRYYMPYSTPMETSAGAPSSAEYSELAQYEEEDDAFINDHAEAEEEHSLN